jgi:hypothetical protein
MQIKEFINPLCKPKKIATKSKLEGNKLSYRTKQKLSNKFSALFRASEKKQFIFCTLTFIQSIDDRPAQSILNKFLTKLRLLHEDLQYIWVAERQDGRHNKYQKKTNNIHFHILINKKIDIDYFNSLWVYQQYKSGLKNDSADRKLRFECIDTTAKNPVTTIKDIHQKKQYKLMHQYLNPVDVKNVKDVNGLAGYLNNYVTKNESIVFCSVWHCSRKVSNLYTSTVCQLDLFDDAGNGKLNYSISKKTGKKYISKMFVSDHCLIHTIYNKKYFVNYMKELEFVNKLILRNECNSHEEIFKFKNHKLWNLQQKLQKN